jgi:hypothetical protein
MRLAAKVLEMGRALEGAATELQRAAGVEVGTSPGSLTAHMTEQARIEEERRRG